MRNITPSEGTAQANPPPPIRDCAIDLTQAQVDTFHLSVIPYFMARGTAEKTRVDYIYVGFTK